ncbi:MAG TPA: CapA family protein [Candidatus Tetragenococcus pullicola]|nr:CapA family protein [Candidatus Tetragenococcus pullicola]
MNKVQKRIVGCLAGIFVITCLITGSVVFGHKRSETSPDKTETSISQRKQTTETSSKKSQETVQEPLKQPLIGLEEKKQTNEEPAKEGEFVLRSVGDLLMHETVSAMADTQSDFYQSAVESLQKEGIDFKPLKAEKSTDDQKDYDFSPMFAQIAPFTEYADATIANLETIATYPELPISGYPQFNGPSTLLENIKNIGIDIVSNGTNHSLDYYTEGVMLSTKYLKEAGLLYTGSYESFEDQKKPRIIEKNGIKVGFLTYTYGTNGIPVEEGKEYTISLIDIDKMTKEISELKKKADVVVVSVHDGPEYETLPNDDQRFVFEMVSEAGADLILGGHPHVLQPVDWYNDHKTFAIYSQASFISGQVNADSKQGGITQVTFKRQENGEVTVTAPKFMPTYIKGVEEQELYEVVPYADYDKYEIPDGNQWWDTLKERMTTYTDDFDYVNHLETNRTKENQTIHR